MGTPATSLLRPIELRAEKARNRIVVSPMCTYSARDGHPDDWHFIHYGRFAMGGAGVVTIEATAISPQARITYGCTGIWSDEHVVTMGRLADAIRAGGALPSLQLGYSGRKGSSRLPLAGGGSLTEADVSIGQPPWRIVAPSAVAANPQRNKPEALDADEIEQIVGDWSSATRRAHKAGFAAVEIHGAHGYLLHSFLSPLANCRTDEYGGSLTNRMRFPLRVAKAVRDAFPPEKPVFYRISAHDGFPGGWSLPDTVQFSRELAVIGLDAVVCSSGGIDAGKARSVATDQIPGYQVPFAEQVRHQADIATMAVGLIVNPFHAASIIDREQADLIAVGREFLHNPNWALHAGIELDDDGYDLCPAPFRWSLRNREPWARAHRILTTSSQPTTSDGV